MEVYHVSSINPMFQIVPTIIIIGFVVVFAIIIINAIKGIGTWSSNNTQPELAVTARIVSKRMNVRGGGHHFHDDTDGFHSTSTYYYATFEVESGDRMELKVSGKDYGMLAEGDYGKLSFQGTRYLGFERGTSDV